MDHPNLSDANYLFGALVQSGAALVAIVGGLLGARYVTLHSEKNATSHILDQAQAELESAELAESRANDAYFAAKAQEWVWLRGRFREALTTGDGSGLRARVSETFGPRSQQAVEAAGLLIRRLETAADDLDDSEISEILDSAISERLYWHEFKHRLPDPPHDPVTTMAALRRYLDQITLTEALKKERGGTEVQRLREKVQDEYFEELQRITGDARTTAAKLEQRLQETRERRQEAARVVTRSEARVQSLFAGESFKLSSQMLAFVMVVTVVLPLVPMIPGRYEWDLWVRITLVSLFLLGILILGRYFWAYGSYLAGKSAMPEHLGRLFWRLSPILPKGD